jgi:hypothetical protein
MAVLALGCLLALAVGATAAEPTARGVPPEGSPAVQSTGNPLALPRWSPYVVGIGIGILSWLTFLLSDEPLGCSAAFARAAGMLECAVRGKQAAEKPYYRQLPPVVEWGGVMVLGVLVGALASALLSGTFALAWVPPAWAAAAGSNAVVRWLVALAGGICLGFGARWAGGCTSGHGISGTLQLAVSSWLAAGGFFVGGILTAMLLFKVILA